jgi:hypothetical protein
MPAQLPTRTDRAAKGGGGERSRQSRLVTGNTPLLIWSFIVCVFAGCLPMVAVHAEEHISLTGSPSLATLSLNLTVVSSLVSNGREQMVRLAFDSRFNESLKELAGEKELNSALPKSLLRKRLVWVNEPRARLRPGFGEFFRGETVEPLRSNGAGVDDSRYLYVKLSFKF